MIIISRDLHNAVLAIEDKNYKKFLASAKAVENRAMEELVSKAQSAVKRSHVRTRTSAKVLDAISELVDDLTLGSMYDGQHAYYAQLHELIELSDILEMSVECYGDEKNPKILLKEFEYHDVIN